MARVTALTFRTKKRKKKKKTTKKNSTLEDRGHLYKIENRS